MLLVFIQSFMFRTNPTCCSCTTEIGHYMGSVLLGDRQIFYSNVLLFQFCSHLEQYFRGFVVYMYEFGEI